MEPICEGFIKGDNTPCAHSVGNDFQFCDLPEMFRCMEFVRRKEPDLSYSTIRNSYCKRKLFWSFICGIELIVKPMPMALGTIADKYLEYLHSISPPEIFNNSFLKDFMDSEGNLPFQIEALIGLFEGYREKGFDSLKGKTQSYFKLRGDGFLVNGFVDLECYEDYIGLDFKYTSKPETYHNKFVVQDQLGTYFLGKKDLKSITIRAFQVPELRYSPKSETLREYRERVKQDFLARPMHYVKDKTFWRTEFNYEELKEKYRMISKEIINLIELGGKKYFYQSNGPNTCFGDTTGTAVSNCEYLSICETGVVSELMYKKRRPK